MATTGDAAFDALVARWKQKLRNIVYKTAGEQQYDDVVHEAWALAHTLRADDGSPLDLRNEAHQQRLLAHLYQHLVRYTEVTVRHAVRLAITALLPTLISPTTVGMVAQRVTGEARYRRLMPDACIAFTAPAPIEAPKRLTSRSATLSCGV